MNRPDVTETALLEIVQQLLQELYPGRATTAITVDNSLDHDLGLDSLGRMELLSRLEQNFQLRLSEESFAVAESLRDLIRLLEEAPAGRPVERVAEPTPHQPRQRILAPHQAATLQEVLAWHLEHQAERVHIHLYGEGDELQDISYQSLYEGACRVATGLQQHGLQPGETVAIMLPTSRGYFFSFLGILLAGGIPVPIYPPARPSQIEDHLRRHARILNNAQTTLLITIPEAKLVAHLLKSHVSSLRQVITAEALTETRGGSPRFSAAKGSDIAFLQYTSGSTGSPKGVILTHSNLLANLRAMGEAIEVTSDDVFVSWLPLYHDMGLIGAWLGSLYFGFPLVVMSPLAFLARPQRWLWAIHNHRGTLSAAPNFAYELCLHKIQDSDLEGLDLGSWRMAFNGAEPVSPGTLRRFTDQLGPFGFRQQVLAPVFGLAESSVGLAFPPPGRVPLIDRIQRQPLTTSGHAIPAAGAETQILEFAACGQPLAGHPIRIVDADGRPLPERREGHLQFHGPSATSGYYRNPEETQRLFDGCWLNTGDLAYIAEGDLYITSRVKDLIIRAGRNIYPYELEEAVGYIPGIRKGCVAVFATLDQATATESVVVLAETRETAPECLEKLQDQINTLSTDLLGMRADKVILAPPHTVLKTSSGKIRRSACRELYEQGRMDQTQQPVWLQITNVALSGVVPQLRRSGRRLQEWLYAAYVWALFGCLAPIVWLVTVSLPRLSWRWRVIHGGARLLASLSGIKITASGLENLALESNYILVANHASYLDAIILAATLPKDCRFVVKSELQSNPVAHLFLQRIRAIFVERFDPQQGLADTQQLEREACSSSQPLFFFPEGTFTDTPGLLPFRMGAFSIAAKAGLAVIPVAIKGSRSLLQGGRWLPRHGAVTVTVGERIEPSGADWGAAIALRDRVRAMILKHCGEPESGYASPLKPT
ncbi:MAG: AMP-binding protein [Candidatus Polarisedimenticolaceae bacterium]|nr:AMP-binding protein [Candidatus Polarisedimenticolaceae bacterium]